MRQTSEQIAAKYKNALSRAMQVTTPWEFKACVEEALAVLGEYGLDKAPYVQRRPAIHGVLMGSPRFPTLHSLLEQCTELTQEWDGYSARQRGDEMRHLHDLLQPEFDVSVQGWIAEYSVGVKAADKRAERVNNSLACLGCLGHIVGCIVGCAVLGAVIAALFGWNSESCVFLGLIVGFMWGMERAISS